jgi:hypothetical protein
VGVADLLSKGASATALAWMPTQREFVIVRRGQQLYDAALGPLYNEGDAIAPYKWIGKNAANYDPEASNPLRDLAVHAADIKDPDMEFRGMAPKSMATSCATKHTCPPEENIFDYLPEKEVNNFSTFEKAFRNSRRYLCSVLHTHTHTHTHTLVWRIYSYFSSAVVSLPTYLLPSRPPSPSLLQSSDAHYSLFMYCVYSRN